MLEYVLSLVVIFFALMWLVPMLYILHYVFTTSMHKMDSDGVLPLMVFSPVPILNLATAAYISMLRNEEK